MQKLFSSLITEKINPKWIIKHHLESLVDGRGKKHRKDYITFFVLPIFPAILIKCLGATLDKDMVDIINTGLALFAGLFLSVSIQLISIDNSKLQSDVAKRIRMQTVYNIAFLILVALVSIVLSYISLFEGVESQIVIVPYAWFKASVDVIVYWFLGMFVLTVLMVLKRTTVLFHKMME